MDEIQGLEKEITY